jgi:hypothetical protein
MIPVIPPSVLRQAEEEERHRRAEEQVPYSAEDLAGGWEFKILRCYLSVFHKPRYFHHVLAEEARAGWELVESLDAGRLRFKRPVVRRAQDATLPEGCNPYRLRVGPSTWTCVMWVLAAVPALFGGIIVLFNLLSLLWETPWDNRMVSALTAGGVMLAVALGLVLLGGRPKW